MDGLDEFFGASGMLLRVRDTERLMIVDRPAAMEQEVCQQTYTLGFCVGLDGYT